MLREKMDGLMVRYGPNALPRGRVCEQWHLWKSGYVQDFCNIREAIEQVLVPKKARSRPLLHDRNSGPIAKR